MHEVKHDEAVRFPLPMAGLEPARFCKHRDLNAARLPFRHRGNIVIIADRDEAKPVLPPFQETVSVVFFSRFRAFARPIARPLRLSMAPA